MVAREAVREAAVPAAMITTPLEVAARVVAREAVALAALITTLQEAPAIVVARVVVKEAVHLTLTALAAAAARAQATVRDTTVREVRVTAKVTAREGREVRAPKVVVPVPVPVPAPAAVQATAEAILEKDIRTPVAMTIILEVGTLVPAQRDRRVLRGAADLPVTITTLLQGMITILVDRQEVVLPRVLRAPRAAAEAADIPLETTTTRVLLVLAAEGKERAPEPIPDVVKRWAPFS